MTDAQIADRLDQIAMIAAQRLVGQYDPETIAEEMIASLADLVQDIRGGTVAVLDDQGPVGVAQRGGCWISGPGFR